MKDTIEKHFDDLKNDLDMDRLRIHSSEAMNGRLFIQFVALILSSYIKTTMKKENWFAKTDMQTVIDEMKSLHVITAEGKRKKLYITATAFQKDVINLFKLNIG